MTTSDTRSTGEHSAALELRDYTAVLRRQAWVVIVFVVLGVLAAGVYAVMVAPTYVSQATIVVKPTKVDLNRTTVRPDLLVNLFTERELIKSETVAVEVSERVPGAPDPEQLLSNLTVDIVDGGEVLVVRYDGRDREVSPLIVQAFANVYLEMRGDDATTTVEGQADELRQKIGEAQDALEEANRQLSSSPEGSVALVSAQSRRDILTNEIQQLQGSLNDVLALAVDPGAIISPASPAVANTVLPPFVLIFVGGFIGFLVGTPVAFLRDRLDRKVRDANQLTRETGIQVFGEIPPYSLQKEFDSTRSAEIVAFPHGEVAESYRRLRTTLTARTERIDSLAVAGLRTAKDGAASVAVNLAVSMAESGLETLLISANFRGDDLNRILNVAPANDLSDVLAGRCTAKEAMYKVVGLPPRLRIVSAGTQAAGTGEAFNFETLAKLIGSMKKVECDFLMIDAPPVLAAADSLRLASLVDGVTLVARIGTTDTDDIGRARNELNAVGAGMVGAVLLDA